MLTKIREGARSFVSQFLVWFIAITFVGAAFLVWGDVRRNPNVVAVAGGTEVSRQELSQAVRQVEATLRAQFGDSIDPSVLSALKPQAIALNTVINAALQTAEADGAGVGVSSAEVAAAVREVPEFAVDGKFSADRYFSVLKLNGIVPADFEANLAKELKLRKLQSMVERSTAPLEVEAYARYAAEHEQVRLRYAPVRAAKRAAALKVTDEGLAAWYETNGSRFTTPEERSFRVLTARAVDFVAAAQVYDEEVEEYYSLHLNEYEVSEQVTASHILVKVTEDAPEAQVAAARARIGKIHERVTTGGEEFAAVANEASEGPSASQGGDLGAFGRGMMVDAFEQVAFTLEPGTTSEPFRTPFGFHVVKVASHEQGRIKPIDEVRGTIVEAIRDRKSGDAARDYLAALAGDLSGENFASATDRNHSLVINSYRAVKGAQASGYPAGIENELFLLEKGRVSSPLPVEGGSALVMVDEVVEPAVPPLVTVRSRAEAQYRREEGDRLASETADRIAAAVAAGTTLEAAARAEGVDVLSPVPFSLSDVGVGGSGEEYRIPGVTDLADGEAKVFPLGDGDRMVAMVAERIPADLEAFRAELPALKKELSTVRRNRVYAQFVEGLRSRAQAEGEIDILVNIPGVTDVQAPAAN